MARIWSSDYSRPVLHSRLERPCSHKTRKHYRAHERTEQNSLALDGRDRVLDGRGSLVA